MAPSATTEEVAPMQFPNHGKGSQTIHASVLHGPRDLRLVRSLPRPSYRYTEIWGLLPTRLLYLPAPSSADDDLMLRRRGTSSDLVTASFRSPSSRPASAAPTSRTTGNSRTETSALARRFPWVTSRPAPSSPSAHRVSYRWRHFLPFQVT